MKKLISLTLCAILCLSLFAGCGKQETTATTEGTTATAYATALDALSAVWETFPEEDRFPAAGGDEARDAIDGPGSFDVNAYGETFQYQILVDDQLLGQLTGDAATLIHMLNTNTFCSAAMRVSEDTDVSAFAEHYKEIVQANRWMCGFPETVVVLSLGDIVFTAYGHDDLIQLFKSGAQSLGATLLVEAPAEA